MKVTFKLIALVLFISTTTLFTSCEKDFNDKPNTPNEPITQTFETVTQSFGLQIGTEVSKMNTKSWNVTNWIPDYSPEPVNLLITGTGSNEGTNYSRMCTVQELKDGITFDMFVGSYHVTFETIHVQAGGFSLNDYTIEQLTTPRNKTVGQYLDIKVDNDVYITGSPLSLTATLQDALVVVDIPEVTKASRQVQESPEAMCSLFLNNKHATDGIFYGYVNAQPLYVSLEANGWQSQKVVNLTQAVNGRAYHLVTPFNAAVELNIPNLESEKIIVP